MLYQIMDYRALALRDLAKSRTIKLEGELIGYSIFLLVESGATHNFIARELLSSLNMEVTPTDLFNVGLANGSKCSSQGICHVVCVKVGSYTVVVDACLLDLGGVDIILGRAWLETVGQTTNDWQRKTISFDNHNQTISLQGYHLHEHPQTFALQGLLQSLA